MSQNATVKIFCLFIRTFCLLVIAVKIDAYEVPPAIVEPLKPVGLRVSIPDHPGITLFAFHGNVNEDFENGREAGQMAVDILRKKNGFWTYTNRNIKLKEGDIIYYWLYVIQDGLGYERLFQSHVVDGFFPSESLPTPPSITKRPVIITTSSTRRPIITEGPSPTPVTDDIGIRRPSNEKCVESMTTVRGEKACSGYMIFESNFANGIGRNWTHEVHFNENESEFVVFDNRVLNTFVESNYLTIKPALLDDYYGPNFAATASDLDLTDRCTSYEEELCKKDKFSFTILPPVISGRLTTKESFSFKYGIVEIKAKLPRGNWVVPEIWLQPKAHKPYGAKNSGKIVVAKSIGNTLLTHEGMSIGNNLLTAGLEVDEMSQTYKKTNAGLWSDRFHIYKLEWTPTGMRFNVDGEEFGKWVGKDLPFLKGYGPVSPFDQEFYLLLGIHAGGYFDVPDGAMSGGRPKPWRNTNPKRIIFFFEDLKNWHATWNDKTKLQIDYIRVWAL